MARYPFNIDVSTVEGQLEVLRLWSSAELNISSACLDPPLGVFCNEGVKESTAILVGPVAEATYLAERISLSQRLMLFFLSASVISALATPIKISIAFRAAAGSRTRIASRTSWCFWMACSWDWLARLVRRKLASKAARIALANCL